MQYKYDNYASIQYRDIMGPSGSFIKQKGHQTHPWWYRDVKLTFAFFSKRITLMPVDASSRLGIFWRYAQTHTSHRCCRRFTWYISAQTSTAMACSTLAEHTDTQHCQSPPVSPSINLGSYSPSVNHAQSLFASILSTVLFNVLDMSGEASITMIDRTSETVWHTKPSFIV